MTPEEMTEAEEEIKLDRHRELVQDAQTAECCPCGCSCGLLPHLEDEFLELTLEGIEDE